LRVKSILCKRNNYTAAVLESAAIQCFKPRSVWQIGIEVTNPVSLTTGASLLLGTSCKRTII